MSHNQNALGKRNRYKIWFKKQRRMPQTVGQKIGEKKMSEETLVDRSNCLCLINLS